MEAIVGQIEGSQGRSTSFGRRLQEPFDRRPKGPGRLSVLVNASSQPVSATENNLLLVRDRGSGVLVFGSAIKG